MMGWYESPQEPGVMLGDEAFDAMYEGLKGVAAAYREGLGRKPTLDEVRALLETELRVAGDELVDGLDELAVKQVTIKTAKKPKDQPFGVGDVFAVPISGGRFAFGRVMVLTKLSGMYIEVFRETSDTKSVTPSILASGWLFQPLRLSGGSRSLKNWRWTVVRSDPSYKLPPAINELEFVSPHPAGDAWCAVSFKGEILRVVSDEEKKTMTSGHFWSPEEVEERIEETLGRVVN
jgi:hypothetical protein